jgi:glycosyltransferase involved in cell wall biosynthesis
VERLDRHRLRERVRLLGAVAATDLPALYAGARALVFPSLFEGFGIPLVEAMLAGCPIAAARATSVPEVVGEAGLLFDPGDPEDAARAVLRLLGETGLAEELVRRGRERARLFTLERNVERTLAVFEGLSGVAPRRREAEARTRPLAAAAPRPGARSAGVTGGPEA